VQDIATEVSTRANADAALEGQITAEAGARANADAALDGKITAEADARTSADTALGQGIDGCVKKAEVSIEAQDNTVVRRDGNGNIIVNTPAENTSSLDKSVAINTAFADKRYLGKIQVAYNSQSHLITFTQLDAEGNTMETPYDIDLPLESLVTNIDDVVVDGERYLQLTLQNDDVKNIALNEIFNGFVKTSVNKSIIYGNDDNGDQTSYAIDDIILLEKRANDNGIVGIAAKGFESKDSTEWVNLGHESEATGLYSFAEGKCTHATGERSHAEGSNTRATHTSTHAEGYNTEAVNHGAHAEGGSTEASGRASHSEGVGTKSTGEAAHAEGYETVADYRAHSEGEYTIARGRASHAGGTHTIASGASQTAIGKYNIEDLYAYFIVGNGTASYRSNAFVVNRDGRAIIGKAPVNEMDVVNKGYADGRYVKQTDVSTEAESGVVVQRNDSGGIIVRDNPSSNEAININFADGRYIRQDGFSLDYDTNTHVLSIGYKLSNGTTATKKIDLVLEKLITGVEDQITEDGKLQIRFVFGDNGYSGWYSLDDVLKLTSYVKRYDTPNILYGTNANGYQKPYAIDDIIPLEKTSNGGIAVKRIASATGLHSFAENGSASGKFAHSEGDETKASRDFSHAEGKCTHATGERSHAEGSNTKATNTSAHSEGYNTEAAGHGAHAEGGFTKAKGLASHTEGFGTETIESAEAAHAEGYETVAGYRAHSEGEYTKASGRASHAGGTHTIASGASQTAIGKYNKKDNNALFIVGNGTADGDDYRSNAFVVNQDGTATIAKAPVNEMDVVNKGYLDAVKAYLESNMSPSEVDLEQYFLAMDTTAVDILMSNAKKCTLSIGMRADVDTPGTTDVFTDEFWSNSTYSFTFTPTEVTPLTEDSYGYLTGSIIGDVIAVNVDAPDGYIVKSATATRFNLALVIYDIETEDIGVQMSTDLTLTVTSPNGIIETFSELLEIHSYRNVDDEWEYKVKKLIVFVPKNDETSPYIPEATATYDLRTQAIDNRLKALIDEAIAKRRAALGETETTEKS